jgi:hypothetical protein
MHNSILEYVSTTSISIVMTMPFHVMPFEKRFLKKWFSSQISSKKTPSPQEKENRKKEKRKKKLQESPQIKGEVNILRGEKHFNFKEPFDVIPFSPLHPTISKTLFKIIEKVFLALFGPSFNLAIYITGVIPFLFTHELHIFSIYRVG